MEVSSRRSGLGGAVPWSGNAEGCLLPTLRPQAADLGVDPAAMPLGCSDRHVDTEPTTGQEGERVKTG